MRRKYLFWAGQAIVVAVVLIAFLRLWTPPVRAASIEVNSTADGVPANDGACTLREAIINANTDSQNGSMDCAAGSGADTITFAPGLSGTITLTNGEIVVSNSLTITGPGANVLAVSGGNASRVAAFAAGAYTVNISRLTVRDGNSGGLCCGAFGVGVGVVMTVDQMAFTNNSSGIWGGAIGSSGQLTVTNSTFTGNNAGASRGGAIYNNAGTLTVTNGRFSGNTSTTGGAVSSNNSAALGGNCFDANATTGGAGSYDVEQESGTLTADGNWWGVETGPNTGGETFGVLLGAALADAAPLSSQPVCGVTFNGTVEPPDLCEDGQTNCEGGEEYAVVYSSQGNGRGALHIYCLDESGRRKLGLVVTPGDLNRYPATPDSDTLVTRETRPACRVDIAFYILMTGEYQVVIGPDSAGDVVRITFTGLPPAGMYVQECNVLTSPETCEVP